MRKFSLLAVALRTALLSAAALSLCFATTARGQDSSYNPKVMPASPDGERAVKGLRLSEGLKAELFAAEPLLANPVAFFADEKGRFYVCETFRHSIGATDNRNHMVWLDDDVAARTVEDRVAMFRKHLDPKMFASYGIDHDRIRLIEDSDSDGKADRATIFADGFNGIPDGIGAGVLARKGDVFYTCIPALWKLRDADGDGKADVRQALHSGYGVHVAFLGHDLHGLRFGPDGKLYFSIGDRGLNVPMPDGRRLDRNIDTGAVLRCDPDGSNLEIYATGMRNPQELAFNEFGDLFTGENNSDSGDQARFVHVVEGIDCGWRIGYQYLDFPTSRGPWNDERLWEPHFPGQAAYIVPPLANFTNGPSGLTYNPGAVRLPDRYKNHFFLCDFKGAANISGVQAFAVKPKGASYEVIDIHQFVWNFQATDVDFAPDGAIYATDWVEGWQKTGKGRIFKVYDPAKADDPAAKDVRDRLARGFGKSSDDELIGLLGHIDQRIRQEAQFELAARGARNVPALAKTAATPGAVLPRLHAIWALGQIARAGTSSALDPAAELVDDNDAEVRAQACKTLGEARHQAAASKVIVRLKDESPRVRMFAALALGRMQAKEAFEPLLAMIRDNDGRDPYLRHAGVMGLIGASRGSALADAARDASPAVRMAAVLSWRRLEAPQVSGLLNDSDPLIASEAARAIYDAPIPTALPQLANATLSPKSPAPLLRRAIQANARLGQAANADRLATIAADEAFPSAIRQEALRALRDWTAPIGRDPIVGLWRPAAARPAELASAALAPKLDGLLKGSGADQLRRDAIQTAGRLKIAASAEGLKALATRTEEPAEVRIEALRALDAMRAGDLAETAEKALTDRNFRVRAEGLKFLAQLDPQKALPLLDQVLERGPNALRQTAIRALGGLPLPEADPILARWLRKLVSGDAVPEIHLDLLEAAAQRKSPEVRDLLGRYEAKRDPKDPIGSAREVLRGGNAERGKDLFVNRTEIACVRCHKVAGKGGEVGPPLDDIGAKRDRDYILESLIRPNAKIAEGFETRVIVTDDGKVLSGVFKNDNGKRIQLLTPEDQVLLIEKDKIEEQKPGASAMPDDVLKGMSKSDLRDLVEYLSQLRTPPARD